jgi:hypothetical protein
VCIEADLGAWSHGERVGVCASAERILQTGLVGTSRPSPRVAERLHLGAGAMQAIALVPDGVKSVSFSDADGNDETAPVRDNVAVGHLSNPATEARFEVDSVVHTVPLGGVR